MATPVWVAGDPGQYRATNLLMVPDGFTRTETNVNGAFHTVCTDIAESFHDAGWLDYGSKLVIWRARTYVTGAHPAVGWGCANAKPPLPLTRFSAQYFELGGECKCLFGSSTAVDTAVRTIRPPAGATTWDMVLVVLNSTEKGGYCSGSLAWTYRQPQYAGRLAMHELGHALGLLDEYDNPCGTAEPAGVPGLNEPNISASSSSPRWWASQPGVPPVFDKSDSADCAGPDSPTPGAIGAFQGGNHRRTAYYRPCYRCRMRKVSDDFCAVCTAFIRAKLYPTP